MGVVVPLLRKSAKGKPCTLRFPCCNRDPETTVLAHLPSKVKGMGTKSDDWHAVYACSSCHQALDERRAADSYWHALNALWETQRIWYEEGLMSFPEKETKRKQSLKIVPRPEHFRR
jgi:hypothetical protein